MATVTRYVNPNSVGGDGTTDALTGANAAYASLSAWESAEQTDLVSDGDSHIVYCDNSGGGGADTTAFAIGGWTTDATHTVTIENTQDPKGVFNTSMYYLSVTDEHAVRSIQNYVYFVKIQAEINYSAGFGTTKQCFLLGNANVKGNIFDRCIARAGTIDPTSTASLRGFSLQANAVERSVAVNCSSYGFDAANGINSSGYYSNVPVTSAHYFCNAYNCGSRGFWTTAGMLLKNCLSTNNGTDYFGAGTLTTCASSDGTGSVGYTGVAANYKDAANGDFHIDSCSCVLNGGTDLSADAIYAVTTDVDGETRANPPRIGYDEVVDGSIGLSATMINNTVDANNFYPVELGG